METFYFKLSPEFHLYENDATTIYRFEEVKDEYKVFFKLFDDDEEEVSTNYTLEEVAKSLVCGHWIVID